MGAQPLDWLISEDDGAKHAIGQVSMSVLEPEGRIFKRNFLKNAGTPKQTHERWLVGELDGVRVYFNGDNLIMTKQDLYA